MSSFSISIVVPVYNVEAFIDNCMRSILCQTYSDYEVILVDDGSTDRSGEQCDFYAAKNTNVKVIHKSNGGLSDARNVGLLNARGEYVLFVDSDDYLAPNALELLISNTEKDDYRADVVIGNYTKVFEDNINLQDNENVMCNNVKKMTGREYLCESLKNNTFMVTAWSKLYRTGFLLDNGLFFEKGILHEDELFTPQVLLVADKVVVTDIEFYRYVIRKGSIMTSSKQIKNAVSIKRITYKLDLIYQKIVDTKMKEILMDHSATIYYQAISRISKIEAMDNNLLEYRYLREHSYSVKNKVRYWAMRLKFELLRKCI